MSLSSTLSPRVALPSPPQLSLSLTMGQRAGINGLRLTVSREASMMFMAYPASTLLLIKGDPAPSLVQKEGKTNAQAVRHPRLP